MKRFLPVYPLALLWLLGACNFTVNPEEDRKSWDVYRPIYMPLAQAKEVKLMAARELKNPGKIYYKNSYIFINEEGRGIHVINNQEPTQPRAVAFISVPGNVDIAIRGTTLYADNFTDLVAIDISNLNNIQVSGRIENVYPYKNYPSLSNIRFECVDPAKGVVVGWEKSDSGDQVKCYR